MLYIWDELYFPLLPPKKRDGEVLKPSTCECDFIRKEIFGGDQVKSFGQALN
jgi:hypothetical protein